MSRSFAWRPLIEDDDRSISLGLWVRVCKFTGHDPDTTTKIELNMRRAPQIHAWLQGVVAGTLVGGELQGSAKELLAALEAHGIIVIEVER